ncbi:hypothetical protein ACFLS5_04860 [Candidatus Bipolaricaulota bacterium]
MAWTRTRITGLAILVVALVALVIAFGLLRPRMKPLDVELTLVEGDSEDRLVDVREFFQNNCGGNMPSSNTYEISHSVSLTLHTEDSIAFGATGSIEIDGIGKVEAGTEIARRSGVEYGLVVADAQSVTLSAAPGSAVTHRVEIYESGNTGTLTVTKGTTEFSMPYWFPSGKVSVVHARTEDETSGKCVDAPSVQIFDQRDDFSGPVLDTDRWQTVGTKTAHISQGHLALAVGPVGEYDSLTAIAKLEGNRISRFQTELAVSEGGRNAYAGIEAHMSTHGSDDTYVVFGIASNGDVFLRKGEYGSADHEFIGIWPGSGPNTSHNLRIEWDVAETRFTLDGNTVKSLPSNGPASWASLTVGTYGAGEIEALFDWAAWVWASFY